MWFLELNFHLCLSRFMYPLKVSRSIPATGRFKWQQWSRILHFYVSNDYLNRLANYFNSNLNMPYHIFSWESLIEIITTASLLVNPQHFLFLLIFKWDGNFLANISHYSLHLSHDMFRGMCVTLPTIAMSMNHLNNSYKSAKKIDEML